MPDSIEQFPPLAKLRGKSFSLNIQDGVSCNGNEESIRHLVSIPADNAIKHSSENGTLCVTLKGLGKSSELVLANPASGISKGNLSTLFERFYRADAPAAPGRIVSVADKDGNMVSFKPSLHTGFGTGVAMGTTGVIFDCRGCPFSLDANKITAIAPHKRPRSTLIATLVTKDGKPFMVLGSPGGDDQPQREVQTIVNIIDFGMNPQDAIEAPRFSSVSFPSSTFPHAYSTPGRITLEGRIPADIVERLKALGHDARATRDWGVGSALSVIMRDRENFAAADPGTLNLALAKRA